MKVNVVQLAISLVVSALIAYGLHTFNRGDNAIVLAVGSFVFLGTVSGVFSGLGLKDGRASINVKLLAGLFYPIGLILGVIFMLVDFQVSLYVILNGIIFLMFLSISYGIGTAKQ